MANGPREALYEIAVDDLDREIRSADALGTRAVAVVGFCGVTLALAATLARDAADRDLGSFGDPAARAALIVGVAAIFLAAVLATSMLTPKQRGRTKPSVMRELRSTTDPEDEIYDRLVKVAITLTEQEGTKNDSRGQRLRRAYLALIVGLAMITGQAIIVTTNSHQTTCTTQTTDQRTTTKTVVPAPSKGRTRATPTIRVLKTSSTACAKATR